MTRGSILILANASRVDADGDRDSDSIGNVYKELRIDFSARGNGAPFRRSGWSTAEPDGTWSLGGESHIVLPPPTHVATHVLVLQMRPMVAGAAVPAQRLQVRVNDVTLADFHIDRRTTRACRIPVPLLRPGAELRIAFATPDAARPADHGQGDDDRVLGINLASLHLYPDIHENACDDALLDRDEPVAVDAAAVMSVEQMNLPDLMLTFESLGQNCEFGLVQRKCGAEPLGLLRFSSTPLMPLLEALDARFAGMGAPESISVDLSPNGREYMVTDRRFGFTYHAWVNAGEMHPEDIMRREARRVPFLVRKLIEDLESGQKTFVFKGMGPITEEEAFPLAMAIRRYGPNRLLLVNPAEAGQRVGAVAARAPGFMVGYVDRFAPGDNAHDLSLGSWVKVCREAHRLRVMAQSARR